MLSSSVATRQDVIVATTQNVSLLVYSSMPLVRASKTRQARGSRHQRLLFLIISQFDCDGNRFLSADCCAGGAFCPVELADQDFQVSTKLDSATLNATFKCFDSVSGLSFNVDVDLNWAGTGGLSRGNGSNHSKTPGCTDNVHFNFTQRDAQASGSVFDGTTNFTPDPSEFANLTAVKTGRVAIGCQ